MIYSQVEPLELNVRLVGGKGITRERGRERREGERERERERGREGEREREREERERAIESYRH